MWFKIKNQQVTFRIFAKPNAKRTALLKVDDSNLHISIHAKPHEGEANKELICYLAKLFRLPKSNIILQSGENAKHKVIAVPLSSRVQEFLNDPTIFLSK